MPFDKPVELFLTEDHESELELFRMALKQWKRKFNLTTASNGEEALTLLTNGLSHKYIPDLIILDLNIPRLDGLELLKEIKTHKTLKLIPTIMFSSSANSEEIIEAYKLNVNSFVQKPISLDQYRIVVKAFEFWWFDIVHLPDGKSLKADY
jgi:CheY-like chemotaxis protein